MSETARARYQRGDRVNVTGGRFVGARGTVTGEHDAYRLTVLFDEWWPVGGGRHLVAAVFDCDLGPYTVARKHRPVSVGAMQSPERTVRRG